jgi:MFS transporter, DHA1 family, multidrug resistance protein
MRFSRAGCAEPRRVVFGAVQYPLTFNAFSSRRRMGVVAILGALGTIAPFSIDLYLPALPVLGDDLGASQQQVAVTVTMFLLGLAVGQVQAGSLSDRHGRRRPLLAGLLLFALASLACAFAPTIQILMAARFLQGLGGAAGMAVSYASVTDYVRGRDAARLFSRLAMIGGIAPVVAPLVGGQLLRVVSWRGLFVVLAGIGLTLFLSVLLGLPESLPRQHRSAAGVRVLLTSLATISRDLGFLGLALTSAFSFAGFFAYLAGSSFVYQEVYGVTPAAFSLLFAVNAVGMLAANDLNHRLLARFTPQRLLAAALVVYLAAGMVALVVLLAGGLPLWALAAPLFVLVASVGLIIPNSTALALSLHPGAAGTASAFFGTLRLGLGALATPLVGLAGGMDGVSMGLVIAAAGVLALCTFAVVAWRDRRTARACEYQPGACGDMSVC